jgi:transposase
LLTGAACLFDQQEYLQVGSVCLTHWPKVFLSHANARLNEYGRNLAVERYLAGQRAEDIAGQLGVSRTTVYEWIARYAMEGPAGLADRSSRPHPSPRQLPLAVEFQVLKARLELHAGPVQLAAELGLPPSTTGQILRRWAVPHLAALDRITGELLRSRVTEHRYEHARPGDLLHADVKKLGRIPPGGAGGSRASAPSTTTRTSAVFSRWASTTSPSRSRIKAGWSKHLSALASTALICQVGCGLERIVMAKRNRTVHRLVAPAFVAAAFASLVSGAAGASEDSPLFLALGVLLVGSLLVLIVTGSVMFVQHYRPTRRSSRAR